MKPLALKDTDLKVHIQQSFSAPTSSLKKKVPRFVLEKRVEQKSGRINQDI